MNSGKNKGARPSGTVEKVEFVDGPQYAASYCNNIGFSVNQNDVVLTFGEILEANVQRAIVERRARITMSAIQAKILAYMLTQNLVQYEASFGEIPLPKDFAEKLAEGAKAAQATREGK